MSRLLCLIAFAAATMFASGANATAPGCESGAAAANIASVALPGIGGVRDPAHVPDANALCAIECAKSVRAVSQLPATTSPDSPPPPAPVARIVKTNFANPAFRLPPPPHDSGPPLTILFGNFRI